MIRILHTADWQLGRPFGNVPGDAGAVLREARFEAVRTIAGLAAEHAVDSVVVTGDVFDGHHLPDPVLLRGLAAMRGYDGPWLLLPGNHDAALAASVWTRLAAIGLPRNVRPLLEPAPLTLCDGRLVVLPAPLTERRTVDDLTTWMEHAETPAAAVRLGLAHGSVVGRLPEAADGDNPIAADRAARARLDYLALGDWHGTLEVGPRAWYSGTPEPDRAKDNDPGNVLLVEIDGPGAPPRITRLRIGRFTWRTATVDCTTDDPIQAVRRTLQSVARPDRALLFLRLVGLVGVAQREALEVEAVTARAAFHHLELDDRDLRTEPDDEDLARLASHPLLGRIADHLHRHAGAEGEERDARVLALRLLWRERVRVGAAM